MTIAHAPTGKYFAAVARMASSPVVAIFATALRSLVNFNDVVTVLADLRAGSPTRRRVAEPSAGVPVMS
jgi:hypothetical protein